MSEIREYEIPCDGEWHNIPLSGKILHVAPDTRGGEMIRFWAYHSEGFDGERRFRVFNTDEELPADVHPDHVWGSAEVGGLRMVHLVELR